MKHFSAARIAELLTHGVLADAIAAAFRDDQIHAPDRLHAAMGPDPRDVLLVMPAWREASLGIVKLVTVKTANARLGHPTVQGVTVVFDERYGTPLATVDATALTRWRTASTSLLAARYLARPESTVMAMVGSGSMADHLIRAYCSEFPLRDILIWSRTAAHAAALAARMTIPGVRLAATADLEGAVRCADIVSCATLAAAPLVPGAWVRPGAHIDLVGAYTPQMRESDDEMVRRAEIYVDTRAGALREAGDLVQPLSAGVIVLADIRGELRDLAAGPRIRRSSAQAVTLFKSVGHAIEDLAAATLLLALDTGVSRET